MIRAAIVVGEARNRYAISTVEVPITSRRASADRASGLAAAASVSQPTIAAYESRRRQPTLPVLWGLLRAAGWEPRVHLAKPDRPSRATVEWERSRPAPDQQAGDDEQRQVSADGLAEQIADTSDHDVALRHTIAFLDASRRPGWTVDLDTEPGPTGDRRWDAMLAAVAETVAHEQDRPVPAWTAAPSRFLDRWWFPVADILGRLPATWPCTPSPARRGRSLHEGSCSTPTPCTASDAVLPRRRQATPERARP